MCKVVCRVCCLLAVRFVTVQALGAGCRVQGETAKCHGETVIYLHDSKKERSGRLKPCQVDGTQVSVIHNLKIQLFLRNVHVGN
ncbi:hypothetical protein BDP55DRAFT_664683 [Colletotrichum godetiae]|uniref:Secreted protein n=1 Tax=Colletotrichum godetiae TaxID=1209918 RepID=A0AAJ0EXE6_9PEZI|nr:uncharacterized protein BDP55DRAFT_664683 [Colletotrichum godetiae]KAK1675129.1 hypothetical protein BDP55DRAFT_664683 [Colletotrichum godetiae]